MVTLGNVLPFYRGCKTLPNVARLRRSTPTLCFNQDKTSVSVRGPRMECGEQADHESLFNESMQAVSASENYRVSYLESVTHTAFTQLHFASVIMLIF